MIVYLQIMARLSENGWSSYRIRKEKVMSEATLSNIRNNQPINTTTIDTICRLCNCQPGDLLRYVPNPSKEQE